MTRVTNSEIAELLAIAAEDAHPPLNRAFRRASRKALLWDEEAALLHQDGRSLTELPGVGPFLEKIIRKWIEPPAGTFGPRDQEAFSDQDAGPFYTPEKTSLDSAGKRPSANAPGWWLTHRKAKTRITLSTLALIKSRDVKAFGTLTGGCGFDFHKSTI